MTDAEIMQEGYLKYLAECEKWKRTPKAYEAWSAIMLRFEFPIKDNPERPFIVYESLPYCPGMMDMFEQPAHDSYYRGMLSAWINNPSEATRYSAEEVLEVIASLQARNSSGKFSFYNVMQSRERARLYRQTIEAEIDKGTARGDAKHQAHIAVLKAFGQDL